VTNDAAIAKKVEMFRNYGQQEKYHHLFRGFNRRLDTLQAAVLRVKLKYLEKWNAARRQHAARYRLLFEKSRIVTPSEAPYAESVWHLYVVRVSHRDTFKDYLVSRGISCGIHYPVPVHLQPAYHDLGYKKGDFPVTEDYAQRIISLPMYPELTPERIARVAETAGEFADPNRSSVVQTTAPEPVRITAIHP
jgi:dTDP-4-amino-4,6-dideoxygalactose transaminase